MVSSKAASGIARTTPDGRKDRMPLREENRQRYPADWVDVVASVRARSGDRCESCDIPRGAWRLTVPGEGDVVVVPGPGNRLSREQRLQIKAAIARGAKPKKRPIRLTTAHLDHVPENCALDNLRHWCERCHNRYDAQTRAEGIKARRREARLAEGSVKD